MHCTHITQKSLDYSQGYEELKIQKGQFKCVLSTKLFSPVKLVAKEIRKKQRGGKACKTERANWVLSGRSFNYLKYGNCRIRHSRICQPIHRNAREECKDFTNTNLPPKL